MIVILLYKYGHNEELLNLKPAGYKETSNEMNADKFQLRTFAQFL